MSYHYLMFKCPTCGGKIAPIQSMREATQVVKRTCRGCFKPWQLVIVPKQIQGGQVDIATFTPLGR